MNFQNLKTSSNKEQNEHIKLNKILYEAAMFCLPEPYRGNSEAVKTKRDFKCNEMFQRSYKQLTIEEKWSVIQKLWKESGYTEGQKPTTEVLSANQKKELRFYAIAVGLHYCKMDDWDFHNEETGEILSGKELKAWLMDKYESKKGYMPRQIFARLFNEYINPKMHDFMIEGGFKDKIKNPNEFYIETLCPEHAQYLIKRFKKIYTNLEKRINPGDVEILARTN